MTTRRMTFTENRRSRSKKQGIPLGAVRHSPLHDLVFGSVTDALFQGAGGLPCLVAA